jgi:maltooligosyltrehalose trehalohydrolase
MGGFNGIAARLPELAELGITAIELMPIAAFPGTRNWGYDGVLPYAVAESYGTLQDLQTLLVQAHQLGISILLDVVYNHFGPDGNFLPQYASQFFRDDKPTPWGPAIDFRVPQVRQFFADNARYWLFEIGFDGLRFDAVHAIVDSGWLDELAADLRREAGERHIHLVMENDDNVASHLRGCFDAQWNDDFHHALHVLLTGETHAYYRDYADGSAQLLGRALCEGFIYQGQPSANRGGEPRGEPSSDLAPTAFINFLQNHDQIGNRAFGERLTVLAQPQALKAAVALLLLAPSIPLIFMGEDWGSRSPFQYFTDHTAELARAVCEGRRREFSAFVNAAAGLEIPDPNTLENFLLCDPVRDATERDEWVSLYRELLSLRHRLIIPRLQGASSLRAEAIGRKAIYVRWRMGDGQRLTIACNLGAESIDAILPSEPPIFGEPGVSLKPFTTLVWLT